MRLALLALAIAASALSSAPLRGQNRVQPQFFGPHTFTRAEGPLDATTVEFGTPPISGYQYAESGEYSVLNITQAAAQSNASIEIDWRAKGAVGPVENEGQCGSDWAFSAKGAVEGEQAIRNGKLPSLSAQELVDCAHELGAQGCNGGLPEDGLLYIKKYGSVASASYPYTARDGVCKKVAVVAKIGGILRSPIGDDVALLAMLQSHGPVSVIIDGNWIPDYRGGVQLNCGSGAPNFVSALLVGALTDSASGEPYWLLKFPYGTAFGINGYAHLSRRRPNECGITDYAIVPLP